MNITLDVTIVYKTLCRSQGPKNKANSKPIKPKTNPIKAKTKPIQTQSNPISLISKYSLIFYPKKCSEYLNNLLISPPFLIDNSIDYALYILKRHIYYSKMEKVSNAN
jgi:hypothetical protein